MAETLDLGKIQGKENGTSSFQTSSWIKDIDIAKYSISHQEKMQLTYLLLDYHDVFVKPESDFRRANHFTHNIDTGDNPPFRQHPYRIPHSQLNMVDEHI